MELQEKTSELYLVCRCKLAVTSSISLNRYSHNTYCRWNGDNDLLRSCHNWYTCRQLQVRIADEKQKNIFISITEVILGHTLEGLHILGANKQTHHSFIRDDRESDRGRAGEGGKSSPLFHRLCRSPVSSV